MSKFIGEDYYEHGSPDRTGILLTNLADYLKGYYFANQT